MVRVNESARNEKEHKTWKYLIEQLQMVCS